MPTDEAQAIEWAGQGAPLLVAGSAARPSIRSHAQPLPAATLGAPMPNVLEAAAPPAPPAAHPAPPSPAAVDLRDGVLRREWRKLRVEGHARAVLAALREELAATG